MIKSYTEILLTMADTLDSYIAPKKIQRSDENFVYLVLKAIAKGYEAINNMVNVLRNKFNPETCSDSDLHSIARIAGTSPKLGTGSGLLITATNTNAESAVTIAIGTYRFELSNDVYFDFPVDEVVSIPAAGSHDFLAFTEAKGAFEVGGISSMDIFEVSEIEIPSDINFSCQSNSNLLGFLDESTLDFRKRILTDPTRQDSIKELELEIQNLPYVFDCNLVFNQTASSVTVGGIDIAPYHLLINIHGDARNEIAEIVARKTVYPTVEVEPLDVVYYYSDVFIDGKYPVFYRNYDEHEFEVTITYAYSSLYNTEAEIESAIQIALIKFTSPTQHSRYITEDDFYEIIKNLNIRSFKLLNVDLYEDGSLVDYVSVEPTSLPKLSNIDFVSENEL